MSPQSESETIIIDRDGDRQATVCAMTQSRLLGETDKQCIKCRFKHCIKLRDNQQHYSHEHP